jgi:hypothetical protein
LPPTYLQNIIEGFTSLARISPEAIIDLSARYNELNYSVEENLAYSTTLGDIDLDSLNRARKINDLCKALGKPVHHITRRYKNRDEFMGKQRTLAEMDLGTE